jgi:hypothetical protein
MGFFRNMMEGVPQDSRRGLWSQSWGDASRGLYHPQFGYDPGMLARAFSQFMGNMQGGREWYLQDAEKRARQEEEDAYRAKMREREDVRWQQSQEDRAARQEASALKAGSAREAAMTKQAETKEAEGEFLLGLSELAKEDPMAAKAAKDLYDMGDTTGAMGILRKSATAVPEDPSMIQGYDTIRNDRGTFAVPYRTGEGGARDLDWSGAYSTAPARQPADGPTPVFGVGALDAEVDPKLLNARKQEIIGNLAQEAGVRIVPRKDGGFGLEDQMGNVLPEDDPRIEQIAKTAEERLSGVYNELQQGQMTRAEAENIYKQAAKKGALGTATQQEQFATLQALEAGLGLIPSEQLYKVLTEQGPAALVDFVAYQTGQGPSGSQMPGGPGGTSSPEDQRKAQAYERAISIYGQEVADEMFPEFAGFANTPWNPRWNG